MIPHGKKDSEDTTTNEASRRAPGKRVLVAIDALGQRLAESHRPPSSDLSVSLRQRRLRRKPLLQNTMSNTDPFPKTVLDSSAEGRA